MLILCGLEALQGQQGGQSPERAGSWPKATQALTAQPGSWPEAPVSQSRAGAAVTGHDLGAEAHSLPTRVPAPGPVPSQEASQQRSVSRKPVGDTPVLALPGRSVTTAIYSTSSMSSATRSTRRKKAPPRLERRRPDEMQKRPWPAGGERRLLALPADLLVVAERGGRRWRALQPRGFTAACETEIVVPTPEMQKLNSERRSDLPSATQLVSGTRSF